MASTFEIKRRSSLELSIRSYIFSLFVFTTGLLVLFITSNNNHRLKSAVDMPICVLKRGNLRDHMSSFDKFARQRNKMASSLDLFRMHLHRQPNANTKLDLRSRRKSKLRRFSGRFQTLIWRTGDKVQNLESPGLSGRVDSSHCRPR